METIKSALLAGESLLSRAGFDSSPRHNAELMLQAAIGVDRTALYLRLQDQLPPVATETYNSFLARRLAAEPIQHIIGWAPFYGRRFLVGKETFIPRFDSERGVARAIEILANKRQPSSQGVSISDHSVEVLDLCCGCGVFGLSIAADLDNVRVTLLDIEETPLTYAARNTRALNLSHRITLERRNALEAFPESWHKRFDLIIANPPYIPVSEMTGLQRDVREGEPSMALTDGGDGLSFYRTWSESVPSLLKPDGRFITEIGDGAECKVSDILRAGFTILSVISDLAGSERAIEAAARPSSIRS